MNSRPPAPKAGALPGCATPRREETTDYTADIGKFRSEPTLHRAVESRQTRQIEPAQKLRREYKECPMARGAQVRNSKANKRVDSESAGIYGLRTI